MTNMSAGGLCSPNDPRRESWRSSVGLAAVYRGSGSYAIVATARASHSSSNSGAKTGRLLDGQTYDEFPERSSRQVPDLATLTAIREELSRFHGDAFQ